MREKVTYVDSERIGACCQMHERSDRLACSLQGLGIGEKAAEMIKAAPGSASSVTVGE